MWQRTVTHMGIDILGKALAHHRSNVPNLKLFGFCPNIHVHKMISSESGGSKIYDQCMHFITKQNSLD